MPAVSGDQFRFMAFCRHTDHPPARCPKRAVAVEFTKGGMPKGLPKKKLKDKVVGK